MVENELLERSLVPKTATKSVKWEPPDGDMAKINFDASFQQDHNTSKAGIITRNKDGLIMVACIYPSTNISTPEMAEAWACLHVVTFGEELGFREICVEGDTLMVDKGVTTTGEDRSCISNVIKAVKCKCANFTKIKFRFVPCSANTTAHALAKEGRSHERLEYWMEEAPASVEDIVNKDRIGIGNE
ncbi:hypothetical protein Golax_004524 [Gossypium laxum]|uniref:RNase H type-1 domain-containing protein n=1 Tax=Gossypium laxum TaxID=34288 RepID=A0A7J9B5R2_9ROSI|nr:hypothetical protein [Gossypium laxum]